MALKHWVWLSSRGGVGPKTALSLLERFDTPEQIYFADKEELSDTGLVSEKQLESLCDKDMSEVRRIIADCIAIGAQIITSADAAYPERLKNIYDPPLLLYVLGRLPEIDEEAAIAIVGTRKCTPYGIKTAERFGYEIARAGGLVVSGLARGIDTAAAKGALRAGGSVVGVLGTPIDAVYPRENEELFADVTQVGAIISEYPPHAPTNRGNFPARNRIMSGISVGVAVIEAPAGSGALITAAHALEQGRDVFAVPGNVDAFSCAGSNALLREGASAAVSGVDIISDYIPRFPEKLRFAERKVFVPADAVEIGRLVKKELRVADVSCGYEAKNSENGIDSREKADYIVKSVQRSALSENEARIADVLGASEMQIDDVIEAVGLSAQETLAALTLLQIKGIAEQSSGKRFKLTAKIIE